MSSRHEELVRLVALLRTRPEGVGYLDVVEQIIDVGSVHEAFNRSWLTADLFADETSASALADAEDDLASWTSAGFGVWMFLDAEYPAQLREIHEMPPIIWTRGELRQPDRGVSVVGTRKPSAHSLRVTAAIAEGLAAEDLAVVSGLAEGIDGQAHAAALDCGGRTVAVIGTGIDETYPTQHAELQEQIAQRGLVLSQFFPGSRPTKASFPMRNAVMSGYSRVSVVVEAGEHSGTRIQGRVAVAHGRHLVLMEQVATTTKWGRALLDRPGVDVATSADEAVKLAVEAALPPESNPRVWLPSHHAE